MLDQPGGKQCFTGIAESEGSGAPDVQRWLQPSRRPRPAVAHRAQERSGRRRTHPQQARTGQCHRFRRVAQGREEICDADRNREPIAPIQGGVGSSFLR